MGTWSLDFETKTAFWSDTVYKIHEVEVGEKIELEKGIEFYHPDFRELITKSVNEAIELKKAWDVEAVIITALGKSKWVRSIGYPVFENGKVVMLEGLFQDIDKYKNTLLNLNKANQKLEAVLESSNIGYWDWNIKDNDLGWNHQMYDMYGFNPSESEDLYQMWTDSIHQEDKAKVSDALEKSLQGESNFDVDFKITRPDGEARYIKAIGSVAMDPLGRPSFMTGINRDITTEKLSFKNLAHAREQLQLVFDAIPGIVMHKNRDDVMVRVNKFSADLMNSVPEKMNGKQSSDFFDPELCRKYHRDDLEVMNSNKAKLGIVEQVNNGDGDFRWMKTDKIPYAESDGSISGVVLCSFDITEQIENQKKLERLIDELMQFNYRISHDLSAPLSSINGLSSITKHLIESGENEEALENLERISNSTSKLSQLIKDLLNLSRSDFLETKIEKFDFKKEANFIFEDLDYKNDLIIKYDFEVEEIFTNKLRLKQVFANLISNAIKYRDFKKEKSFLKISSQINTSNDSVELSFEDNGLGIPSDYHEDVFQMFKRFHHGPGGSGLGLYLVKKHLDALDASINFESSEKGTSFNIVLPRVKRLLDEGEVEC